MGNRWTSYGAWWIPVTAAAAAKSLQSCPTLCDPIDSSPSGSPVPGILQARTVEWVAISFSNARKWNVKVKWLSCVRPSATPWTAAYQPPPPMGFSRQEYWSGVPLPSPQKFVITSQMTIDIWQTAWPDMKNHYIGPLIWDKECQYVCTAVDIYSGYLVVIPFGKANQTNNIGTN